MKLKSYLGLLSVIMILSVFSGCSNNGNVGRVCMGDNLDTLFESLPLETKLKVKNIIPAWRITLNHSCRFMMTGFPGITVSGGLISKK